MAGKFDHNHEEFDKARVGKIQSEYIEQLLRVGGSLDNVMDEIHKHPELTPSSHWCILKATWVYD